MNEIIIILLFVVTGLFTRILTHLTHDTNNYYGSTVTGKLRRKLSFDLHHIHFGLILLPFGIIFSSTIIGMIILIISLSLIADQIVPLLKLCDYFSKWGISWCVINHIIVILLTIIIFNI